MQGLHNGAWLLLDFDRLKVDLTSLFNPDNFPQAALTPHELFLEETWKPLLRASDEFTAKVTYEHQAALAQGAFQDRTKAHAPERVADVDKNFNPKDAFRLIVVTKQQDLAEELYEQMTVYTVEVSEQQVKDQRAIASSRQQAYCTHAARCADCAATCACACARCKNGFNKYVTSKQDKLRS